MFCDKCGSEVRANQKFCSACGKEMAPMGLPAPASRLSRHLHLLGILWSAYSVLSLIGAIVIGIVAHTIFGPGSRISNDPEFINHSLFVHSLLTFIAMLVFVKAFVSAITGFGLMNRQSWARPLALVWAFLAMLNIPFGMALGIYTLWVLMSPSADEEYRRITAAS